MNEKFTPGESADGLVLGQVETTKAVARNGAIKVEKTAENLVSASAALASTKPFAVLDAMRPGERLRLLIETAQNFRRQHPERPVMATELAVNEVLRQRAVIQELEANLNYWMADSAAAWDRCEERRLQAVQLKEIVDELRRPWWRKFFKKAPSRSLAARLQQLSDVYFDRA